MQGTQRDADLAAWWGWVPKVLGTVFPSGGAGRKSLRDEVWCCALTARPGSVGSLRPAAPQPCSVGAVTPGQALRPLQAHAPVCAEGGPRPSRAHSRVRRGGRRGQAARDTARVWFQWSPGQTAVQPEVARAQGGEPRGSQSWPHFRPPALGGPDTPAWWRGQNCRSGGPPAFHYPDGGLGGHHAC